MTSFPHAPYKLFLPSKNILGAHHFFPNSSTFNFIAHRELVNGSFFQTLWKFFQTLFLCIHLFVQQLTYFLMDFSQTFISTSPMYALPVIPFSACNKHLNLFVMGYYTAG